MEADVQLLEAEMRRVLRKILKLKTFSDRENLFEFHTVVVRFLVRQQCPPTSSVAPQPRWIADQQPLAPERPPALQFTFNNQHPMNGNINHQINSGTFNAPVGVIQTFTQCYNNAAAVDQEPLSRALTELVRRAENIAPQLAASDRNKLEKRLKLLTETLKEGASDKEEVEFSAKGIIEAASVFPAVVSAAEAVLAFFTRHTG